MNRIGALTHELRGILDESSAVELPAGGGESALEPEVLKTLNGLSEALASSQRELAGYHKKLAGAVRTSKRGEDIRPVLLIVKEAHGILGDLRKTMVDEFGLKV